MIGPQGEIGSKVRNEEKACTIPLSRTNSRGAFTMRCPRLSATRVQHGCDTDRRETSNSLRSQEKNVSRMGLIT